MLEEASTEILNNIHTNEITLRAKTRKVFNEANSIYAKARETYTSHYRIDTTANGGKEFKKLLKVSGWLYKRGDVTFNEYLKLQSKVDDVVNTKNNLTNLFTVLEFYYVRGNVLC